MFVVTTSTGRVALVNTVQVRIQPRLPAATTAQQNPDHRSAQARKGSPSSRAPCFQMVLQSSLARAGLRQGARINHPHALHANPSSSAISRNVAVSSSRNSGVSRPCPRALSPAAYFRSHQQSVPGAGSITTIFLYSDTRLGYGVGDKKPNVFCVRAPQTQSVRSNGHARSRPTTKRVRPSTRYPHQTPRPAR